VEGALAVDLRPDAALELRADTQLVLRIARLRPRKRVLELRNVLRTNRRHPEHVGELRMGGRRTEHPVTIGTIGSHIGPRKKWLVVVQKAAHDVRKRRTLVGGTLSRFLDDLRENGACAGGDRGMVAGEHLPRHSSGCCAVRVRRRTVGADLGKDDRV
jgi:hypothetical protein